MLLHTIYILGVMVTACKLRFVKVHSKTVATYFCELNKISPNPNKRI